MKRDYLWWCSVFCFVAFFAAVAQAVFPFHIASSMVHVGVAYWSQATIYSWSGQGVTATLYQEPEKLVQGGSPPTAVAAELEFAPLHADQVAAQGAVGSQPTQGQYSGWVCTVDGLATWTNACTLISLEMDRSSFDNLATYDMESEVNSRLAGVPFRQVTGDSERVCGNPTVTPVSVPGYLRYDVAFACEHFNNVTFEVYSLGGVDVSVIFKPHCTGSPNQAARYNAGGCEMYLEPSNGKPVYRVGTGAGGTTLVKSPTDPDQPGAGVTVTDTKISRSRPHGQTQVTGSFEALPNGKVKIENKQENVFVLKHDGSTTTATVTDECTYNADGTNAHCSHTVAYTDGSQPHPDDILPGHEISGAGDVASILKGDHTAKDEIGQQNMEAGWDTVIGEMQGLVNGVNPLGEQQTPWLNTVYGLFSVGGQCPQLFLNYEGTASDLLAQFCDMWDVQGGRLIMGWVLYGMTLIFFIHVWSGTMRSA